MRTYGLWIGAVLATGIAIAGCGSDEGRAAPYEICEESEDCSAETAGCGGVVVDYVDYRTEERLFCTSACVSDDECAESAPGVPGACVDFGGGTAICYRRCASDEVCPENFGCIDRLPAEGGGEMFFDPICLPVR